MFCFALGLWMTPENLSSLGIMDRSLASGSALTRSTALWEIHTASSTLILLGIGSMLIGLVYPRLTRWPSYQRFVTRPDGLPTAYTIHLTQFFSPAFWIMVGCLVLSAVYLRVGNDLLSSTRLASINREDGLLETLSAVILLLAAGYAASVAVRLHGRGLNTMRIMHGFLALLFFAMAGEEVSWGQRHLGLETPGNLQGLNVQNEINLHNMFGYVFDHLFILCFFLWGCVAPLLYATSRFFRQIFNVIGLPIPGFGLAIGMLFVTLTQEQLTDPLFGTVKHLRVPELREFLSAIAFLLLMWESSTFLVPERGTSAARTGLGESPE